MADGNPSFFATACDIVAGFRTPTRLLDTHDHRSHRDIEEPGQVYSTYDETNPGNVVITTCEASIEVADDDFDELVLNYVRARPALREALRAAPSSQAGVA